MAQPDSGIPALVRRLRRGGPQEQLNAAAALFGMLHECQGSPRLDAMTGSMAAADAIPALAQIIGTSRSNDLVACAAGVVWFLAPDSPLCREAVLAAGGLARLVQLVRSGDVHHQSLATKTVGSMVVHSGGIDIAATAAAEAAGALPVAVELLSSSQAGLAADAASLLGVLALNGPSRKQAIHKAGAIPRLVRCLEHSSRGMQQDAALVALRGLAEDSVERCQAIAAAGGAQACVDAFNHPCGRSSRGYAARLLCIFARHRQSLAVIAADPSGAVDAALQQLLQRASRPDAVEQEMQAALSSLAAARQALQAASPSAAAEAAAAPAEQASGPSTNNAATPAAAPAVPSAASQATAASPAQPHVCAAPAAAQPKAACAAAAAAVLFVTAARPAAMRTGWCTAASASVWLQRAQQQRQRAAAARRARPGLRECMCRSPVWSIPSPHSP